MTDTRQPFISFVTPFYNTAEFLAECIESVLAQTYSHWEYILVNNCSTDDSLEIARRYAASEPRIRIVNNTEFLGQIANYNHALRQISPEAKFVKMVQADDWLFPDCAERMVAVAVTDPEIAIVSAYSLRHNFIGCVGLPYPSHVTPGEVALRLHLLEGKSVVGTPTNVLYRADLVRERNPFFPDTSMMEDLEVCYLLLMGRKLGFVHQVLTYVREDNQSISGGLLAYNPWVLHRLILLRKYGSQLLSQKELDETIGEVEKRYMRFLGYARLTGRPKKFWEYQRLGFSAMNEDLATSRVWRASFGEALRILRSPGRVRQWLREVRQRTVTNGKEV